MVADVFVLAEIHSAVGHTMAFFQNPHVLGWEDAVGKTLSRLVARLRKVGYKLFGIDRDFQQAVQLFRRGGQRYVQVSVVELLHQ